MPLERVPIAYRPPFDFRGKIYFEERPPGASLLEIVQSIKILPKNFIRDGYVCINGEIVPREMWMHVRPKPTCMEVPVSVTLHMALQGGGQGGGTKSIIGIVAAIALVVITAGIASPVGAAFLGLAEPLFLGITGAQILAGAVGIAGALAISALTAPPTTASQADAPSDTNTDNKEPAAAQGNIIDKGGAIPRVIGTRKVFPPLAQEPVVELRGQDEYVEALFVLNGPHLLEDIRIDGVPVDGADDIELNTREGWDDDGDVGGISRQGRTSTPQLELSTHALSSDDFTLVDQGTPTNSLPKWHVFSSKKAPDEVWFQFVLPSGTFSATDNVGLRLPIRMSFRRRGDSTWINLPELHLGSSNSNPLAKQVKAGIKLKWESPSSSNEPSSGNGWYYAHLNVPPQTSTPATPGGSEWDADSYFNSGGGGDDYWFAGNTTKVQNLSFTGEWEVTVFLDPGTFAQDAQYEFQIKRGSAYRGSTFTKTTYQFGANVVDLFWYRTLTGVHKAPADTTGFSDHIIVTRLVSIWNQNPLLTPGNFALIAIRTLNRTIRQLSVRASGYVKDWDGGDWANWVTTSNPAPHFRDVLTGTLNLDPLPTDTDPSQVDDETLLRWRSLANLNNWTVDTIINDMRTQDVLNLIASCGYARPYQSDVYGVVIDNDRFDEAPVQVFSRRNCANMSYEKAFARVPAGFNVTYRNEEDDDDQAQTVVNQRDPANSDLTSLEAISYDGLIREDKVRCRAQFDLDQANLRSTFYRLNADIESLVCRRGSLVAVQHDILTDRCGDGYIKSIQDDGGGNITGVTIDSKIHIDADGNTGIAIRHNDGTISTHLLSNTPDTDDDVLTFVDPFPIDGTIEALEDHLDSRYGSLVVAGHIDATYKRMLVQNIVPGKNLEAQLTLVDEAPELIRMPTVDFTDGDAGHERSFLVPDGVTAILVELWAGGGGGRAGTTSAPGGGGGGYVLSFHGGLTAGQRIYYYIGRGGEGHLNSNGDNGEDSWCNFDANRYPVGGDNANIASGGTGGTSGASAGGSSPGGDVVSTGGAGAVGNSTRGGGGGGGAGSGDDGAAGTSGAGGGAGGAGGDDNISYRGGDGGAGRPGDGDDGNTPGGGGGGSRSGTGGRGGNGLGKFTAV